MTFEFDVTVKEQTLQSRTTLAGQLLDTTVKLPQLLVVAEGIQSTSCLPDIGNQFAEVK